MALPIRISVEAAYGSGLKGRNSPKDDSGGDLANQGNVEAKCTGPEACEMRTVSWMQAIAAAAYRPDSPPSRICCLKQYLLPTASLAEAQNVVEDSVTAILDKYTVAWTISVRKISKEAKKHGRCGDSLMASMQEITKLFGIVEEEDHQDGIFGPAIKQDLHEMDPLDAIALFPLVRAKHKWEALRLALVVGHPGKFLLQCLIANA